MTKNIITAEAWNAEKDAAVDGSTLELNTAEWSGIAIEPVQVLELDAGAGRPLAYEPHKRGSNWVAKLTGKNAATMERTFLEYRNRLFDYASLLVGDVIEVGHDYTTSGGNKYRRRLYIVIMSVDDDRLFFVFFDTAAQAMKAARTRRKNLEDMTNSVTDAEALPDVAPVLLDA